MTPGLAAAGASLAALGAGLGIAVGKATNFDEAMVNIQAVTGRSDAEIDALSQTILEMGGGTVHGPQAVADAMYDIVGGVADATTHMNILRAAMSTATAGNADLAGTTKALISVMNSYKFGADKAGFASDVLTRTVGMGVGTMDEFASALPQVTGLANSLGIGFDDLGAMTAYLTTQGNTASQSTTQLGAMMTALLNPNETMKDALTELGFTTGQAAIEQLGLIGAFQALSGTTTATEKGMAKMSGSVEALRGITSFAGPDVAAFFDTFKEGVTSATDKAAEIQMGSAANQFALLQSSMDQLAISVGTALLPVLTQIVADARPIIDSIIEWIGQNPQLTQTVLTVAGALAVVVPLIAGAKFLLGGLSGIVSAATGAFGLLFSPIGLTAAAIAGLVFAAGTLYPGGIAQLLRDAGRSAEQLAYIFGVGLSRAAVWVGQKLEELYQTILNILGVLDRLKLGLSAYGGAGANLGSALGMVSSGQVSPGDFLSALVGAIGSEIGFASGGYTGDASGVAGVVHGREYVVPEAGALVMRGEGGGGFQIGTVIVYANDPAAFERQLQEERRRLG